MSEGVSESWWLCHGPFLACLMPFVVMMTSIAGNTLGPDPAEALMHMTGEWAARFLILALLMSPLRNLHGSRRWLLMRRMLGLFAFFYGCLHLLLFLHFFLGWSPARVAEELVERPYITAGFGAWLVMLPLAATSTRAMQRRLGRLWVRLHRGVYLCAVLICLHILWQARSDLAEALAYSLIFGGLLAWRVKRYLRRN